MIRAVIVDDESPARREMKRLLSAHADVEMLGDFATAADCAAEIGRLKPDVVFLDIQMPGENGLDASARLAASGAHIVFVTAFDQHAVRAFELAAFDYLLKPVEPDRLGKTLERIRSGQAAEADEEPPWQESDRIFLRTAEQSWFTAISEIRLLESEGNHTRVRFGTHQPLIGRSLSAFGKRLPDTLFFQANRSQIVNLTFIRSTEDWFGGTMKATLEDDTVIEFSRRQAKLFREKFGL